MRVVRLLPLLTILAAGCLAAPPDQVWLQQRKSVAAIPDINQRAQALRQICQTAASAGDASAVRLMLGDLEADPRHDELAAKCAVALAGKDKDAARRIAKLVVDRGMREKAVGDVEAVKDGAGQ